MEETAMKNGSHKGFHIEEGMQVFDLVCGMALDKDQVAFWEEYKGKVYYFCSENCREHFRNNPEMYLTE